MAAYNLCLQFARLQSSCQRSSADAHLWRGTGDLLSTQVWGEITYPRSKNKDESISYRRLLECGQHTLPSRRAEASRRHGRYALIRIPGAASTAQSMSQHDTFVTVYVESPRMGLQPQGERLQLCRVARPTPRTGDLDKVARVCGDGTVGKTHQRVTATTVPPSEGCRNRS